MKGNIDFSWVEIVILLLKENEIMFSVTFEIKSESTDNGFVSNELVLKRKGYETKQEIYSTMDSLLTNLFSLHQFPVGGFKAIVFIQNTNTFECSSEERFAYYDGERIICKNFKDSLVEKITEEFEMFEKSLSGSTPSEMLALAHQYVVKKSIVEILSKTSLTINEIVALNNTPSVISKLYFDCKNIATPEYEQSVLYQVQCLAKAANENGGCNNGKH